jgi:hypothetical protein
MRRVLFTMIENLSRDERQMSNKLRIRLPASWLDLSMTPVRKGAYERENGLEPIRLLVGANDISV